MKANEMKTFLIHKPLIAKKKKKKKNRHNLLAILV